MTEKLKEYLKEEINHKILEIVPNNSDQKLEHFFDSIYLFISQLEKDSEIPAIAFKKAKKHFATIKTDEQKRIIVKAVLMILSQVKYSSWQFKAIYLELEKYSNVLENSKFIQNLGTNLKPAIYALKDHFVKKGQERQTKKLIELINNSQVNQSNKNREELLFQLSPKVKEKVKIIKLIHTSFVENMYFDVDYQVFERHFFDNGKKLIQIPWGAEITKLKGFVDSLFNENMIKAIKNSNVFIASHFNDDGEPINPRYLGNVNAKKEYMDICHDKKEEHPIVQLLNKIKTEIS